jgi:hypothetical protein
MEPIVAATDVRKTYDTGAVQVGLRAGELIGIVGSRTEHRRTRETYGGRANQR